MLIRKNQKFLRKEFLLVPLLVVFFGIFSIEGVFAALENNINVNVKINLCGDNIIEGAEECEGVNLNGATCQSLGYESGTLVCDIACEYDRLACETGSPDEQTAEQVETEPTLFEDAAKTNTPEDKTPQAETTRALFDILAEPIQQVGKNGVPIIIGAICIALVALFLTSLKRKKIPKIKKRKQKQAK